MKSSRRMQVTQWLPALVATGFAGVLTLLLSLGWQRAAQLQAASTALQSASELRSQPDYFGAQLALLQRGLESRSYVGESLRNIGAARKSYDSALGGIEQLARAAGADAAFDGRSAALRSQWGRYSARLGDVEDNRDSPYTDTAQGSQLSAVGERLKRATDSALERQQQTGSALAGAAQDLATALRLQVEARGRELRTLLIGGAALAALLLVLMLYFAWRSRVAAHSARQAQEQMADILGTVREGLFLLDRDLKFGSVFSDSFGAVLRRQSTVQGSFADLLGSLVSDKTRQTALKFVNLLWKQKINEELIDSVNPLAQLEVQFVRPGGGQETRHLSFAFKRVRREGVVAGQNDYLLGSLTDITDRVLLARELEQSKAENQSQMDLAMEVLRVPPLQLQSFIRETDLALRRGNAILTVRGHGQADLKAKLNGVFREVHTAKGEAGALGLGTVASRLHQLEDQMAALRSREQLDGNDFLPLVVRLDELLSHLGDLGRFAERLDDMKPAQPATMEISAPDVHDTQSLRAAAASAEERNGAELAGLLDKVAQEVARSVGKSVVLRARGLGSVPMSYAKAVKDVTVQLVRNAVAHGVEAREQRVAAGKPETGLVQVQFETDGANGYRLSVEDDGHGLRYEKILDQALRVGLLQPQEAAQLDRLGVYKLIFRPGFSTAGEVTEHAGRGVGLDAVSQVLGDVGGSIGLATGDGKFTRFRLTLPALAGAKSASAA
ncbi:MAG: ATP-binding protein [Steroidobacteraceae bacterium]